MGLDWNPLARPKSGHEAEFLEIFQKISKRGDDKISAQVKARFNEISEAPFEVLGAPRVGFDESANEWLQKKSGTNKNTASFEKLCKRMHGYYVLDLLPECDGFPVYSHHGLYEGVDRYSFRAKFLEDTLDIIGEAMYERAFSIMLAEELGAYAKELYEKASAYARSQNVSHVERMRDCEEEENTPTRKAHILFSAAKWCLYWAKLGHGLEPYY